MGKMKSVYIVLLGKPKEENHLGYLFNIVESPKCTCEEGDQSVDNILFD
jgi:hypothetical protein